MCLLRAPQLSVASPNPRLDLHLSQKPSVLRAPQAVEAAANTVDENHYLCTHIQCVYIN